MAKELRHPRHGDSLNRPDNDFVLYVEDDDDLREVVVELVTAVLERRCGSAVMRSW